MRLLVLAYDIPATSNMAGSPRLFNLCKELSNRHQISLAAFSCSKERYQWFMSDRSTRKVFQNFFILPQPPAPTWWGKQKHRVHPLGAYFATQYRCPNYHQELLRMIGDIASKEAVNLVYVDGLPMAQYVDANEKRSAIIDLCDSMTLLFTRMTKVEKNLWRKFLLYFETMRVARWEKSLRKSFPLIIVNSKVDEAFLRKLDPLANTLTITNGVDSDFFFPKDGMEFVERLIFVGVMGYGPNEDGVLYFCDEIFPLIRQQCPNAEFWAVGKGPSLRMQSLSRRPGVHVTGGVDDIRPYVQSASVFVSPIRYGAGIKNKILAALAMQKPVVATSLSVEGLEVQDNHHLLIADAPGEFAAKVVYILRNRCVAESLGQNGRSLVREQYSWKAKAQSVEDALLTLLNTKES